MTITPGSHGCAAFPHPAPSLPPSPEHKRKQEATEQPWLTPAGADSKCLASRDIRLLGSPSQGCVCVGGGINHLTLRQFSAGQSPQGPDSGPNLPHIPMLFLCKPICETANTSCHSISPPRGHDAGKQMALGTVVPGSKQICQCLW